ncbi:MAG TPA: ABC transporter ATP-binding protein [Myxococcales bacterium]|nr:ABC transporter ATP-binding protein [Myxococcales bacterium]
MSDPLIRIRGLQKSYTLNGKRIEVLRGVDLDIAQGEMVALVGASGVGKSTFLHVLGTLDLPSAGEVRIAGEDVFARSEAALADFRNRTIGFVFQSHYLLPEFSALTNAAMPALIQRLPEADAQARAKRMLEAVGLGERLDHKPGELSGGEQQRVALARALVLEPRLLLADEPTGNLDPQTGEGIHELLFEMNRKLGITAVVVTHNETLAKRMPRSLRLAGGLLA